MGSHQRVVELLTEYYFVGGMPEAVAAFCERHNISEVESIHRSLMATFKADIPKYEEKHKRQGLMLKVLYAMSIQVGNKVKFSEFADVKAEEVRIAITKLEQAKLNLRVQHSNCSGLPLMASSNSKIFKLYFLDIGLLNHLAGLTWSSYQNLPKEQRLTTGKMAEQFIAQHLGYLSGGHEEPNLYYWLRDAHSQKAEIDFVWVHEGNIYPIEVKAGKSRKTRSLDYYMLEHKARFGLALGSDFFGEYRRQRTTTLPLGNETQEVSYQIFNLPLYRIQDLSKLLEAT